MPPGLGGEHGVDAALERRQRQDRRRAARGSARCRPPAGSRGVNSNGAAWPSQPDSGCAETASVRARSGAPRRTPARRARRSGTCSRSRPRSRRPRRCRSTGTAPAECAQVPDRQRARPRARRRVSAAMSCMRAGAVVDMGQHQHRDVAASSCAPMLVGRSTSAQLAGRAARASALGDVEIGRKVARARTRSRARGASACAGRARRQHLEQIDRRRVGDDHLAGAGADQPRDLVADARGSVDPAGRVPAPDQALAPFALHHRATRAAVAFGSAPERIAVEVDHALAAARTARAAAPAGRRRPARGSLRGLSCRHSRTGRFCRQSFTFQLFALTAFYFTSKVSSP